MIVAISTDGINVSAHFGRCPKFTLVEIQNGELIDKKEIDNPGHHPGYLPKFLKENSADIIVAGGMGFRAKELFKEAGIEVILGIQSTIDEAVNLLKEGNLMGGESTCVPQAGKGYGLDKTVCDHE